MGKSLQCDTDGAVQASSPLVICPYGTLCRYFSVHIASPANELSRERGDQTQGAAEEAAGCLLWQVRFFNLHQLYFYTTPDFELTQKLKVFLLFFFWCSQNKKPLTSKCSFLCRCGDFAGTRWLTVAEQASARPPMTRAASHWTTEFCTQSNVSFVLHLHVVHSFARRFSLPKASHRLEFVFFFFPQPRVVKHPQKSPRTIKKLHKEQS